MRMMWLVVPCCVAAGCGDSPPNQTDTAADQQAETTAGSASDPGVTAGSPGSQDQVPVTISFAAGGETPTGGRGSAMTQRVVGAARCNHTQQASIYGVEAAMWFVEYRGNEGPIQNLTLTVWQSRSASAPDQFSLHAASGSTIHRIDTVRGGQPAGSGSIALHREGEGARFEIEGRDAEGAAVRATVQCTRFTAPVPVGG